MSDERDLSRETWADRLEHVAEASKNARGIFIGMLAACLYSLIAIASVTDLDLLVNDRALELPIVGVKIPPVTFFWVTPALLVVIYAYLHLYLMTLWRAIGALPARLERLDASGAPRVEPIDEHLYPWMLTGLARWWRPGVGSGHAPMGGLANGVAAALAWGFVPLTLVAFEWRYLYRHEAWGSLWHVFLIFIASAMGVCSYRAARDAAAGESANGAALNDSAGRAANRERAASSVWLAAYSALPLAALLGAYAHGGGVDEQKVRFAGDANDAPPRQVIRMSAGRFTLSLPAAALSERPNEELTWEEAERAMLEERFPGPPPTSAPAEAGDDESASPAAEAAAKPPRRCRDLTRWDRKASVVPAGVATVDIPLLATSGIPVRDCSEQLVALRAKGRTQLRSAALSGRDLRGADLRGAYLVGARAYDASFDGADLSRANLQGLSTCESRPLAQPEDCAASFRFAFLTYAKLQGAEFRRASFDGAYLGGASLDGASLRDASLVGADLETASLVGADLRYASLDGASLGGASLVGANLNYASLDGAFLRQVSLDDAQLRGASLDGAVLEGASLDSADIVFASFVGADFRNASLDGALILYAILDDALVRGVDMSRVVGLEPEQARAAFGDHFTLLPDDVPAGSVAGCFDAPPQFEMGPPLWWRPDEWGHAVRQHIFCQQHGPALVGGRAKDAWRVSGRPIWYPRSREWRCPTDDGFRVC